MRVSMSTQISGTRDGAAWPPSGSVIDLPDDEAVALVKAGMATPARDAAPAEHTIAKPAAEQATATPETSAKPRKRAAKKVAG